MSTEKTPPSAIPFAELVQWATPGRVYTYPNDHTLYGETHPIGYFNDSGPGSRFANVELVCRLWSHGQALVQTIKDSRAQLAHAEAWMRANRQENCGRSLIADGYAQQIAHIDATLKALDGAAKQSAPALPEDKLKASRRPKK